MDDLAAAQTLYDTVADSYARLLPDATFEAEEELAMITRFAGLLPSEPRVLDAGCGTGRMQPVLRSLMPRMHAAGVDLSDRMLEHARRGHPEAEFRPGRLAELPFEPGCFDAVFAWYSIIHTAPADLAPVFAEMRRVITTRGLVLLGFQHGSGERHRSTAYGHRVALHAHLHSAAGTAETLEATGFSVIEALARPARAGEAEDQGFVLARAS
ncbi:class I SAM-dependent DNA methyltransferase [Microbacterium sp. ZW T5_56]|uniref:class I SAM-dependent DNA methyltransferase n=1 Tax=Microbacterium sp. ZW T5_56 TaxID=3378081 RepID=UPI003851F2A1